MLIRSVPSHSNCGLVDRLLGIPAAAAARTAGTRDRRTVRPEHLAQRRVELEHHRSDPGVHADGQGEERPDDHDRDASLVPWMRCQGVSPACAIANPRHRSTRPLTTRTRRGSRWRKAGSEGRRSRRLRRRRCPPRGARSAVRSGARAAAGRRRPVPGRGRRRRAGPPARADGDTRPRGPPNPASWGRRVYQSDPERPNVVRPVHGWGSTVGLVRLRHLSSRPHTCRLRPRGRFEHPTRDCRTRIMCHSELTIIAVTALLAGLLLVGVMLAGRRSPARPPTSDEATLTPFVPGESRVSDAPSAPDATLRVVWWLTITIVHARRRDQRLVRCRPGSDLRARWRGGAGGRRLPRGSPGPRGNRRPAGRAPRRRSCSSRACWPSPATPRRRSRCSSRSSAWPPRWPTARGPASPPPGSPPSRSPPSSLIDPNLGTYGPEDVLRLSVGLVATWLLAFVAIAYCRAPARRHAARARSVAHRSADRPLQPLAAVRDPRAGGEPHASQRPRLLRADDRPGRAEGDQRQRAATSAATRCSARSAP